MILVTFWSGQRRIPVTLVFGVICVVILASCSFISVWLILPCSPTFLFMLLGSYQGGCCWGASFTHRLLEGNGVVLWCGTLVSRCFCSSNDHLNAIGSSALTHWWCDWRCRIVSTTNYSPRVHSKANVPPAFPLLNDMGGVWILQLGRAVSRSHHWKQCWELFSS